MERRVDEEEHSGEMQYPYIKKIINDAKESSGKINFQSYQSISINQSVELNE